MLTTQFISEEIGQGELYFQLFGEVEENIFPLDSLVYS